MMILLLLLIVIVILLFFVFVISIIAHISSKAGGRNTFGIMMSPFRLCMEPIHENFKKLSHEMEEYNKRPKRRKELRNASPSRELLFYT